MKKLTTIIRYLFLALFLLTPLIFNFHNSELFEVPKIYFIYTLTIIITTLHLINWAKKNVVIFRHTFLDIPLISFIISQTISTFISIDISTSFYGYYSRLNGGFLSILTFSLLYWVLAVYIDKELRQKIIKTIILSGLLVSIYAIAEHFGVDKNIWLQDVQNRVFSTLGQPNWLAAFLVMIIPLSLSQLINSKNKKNRFYYFFTTSLFYLSLLFTKSKSGIIAGLISLFIFFLFYLFSQQNKNKLKNKIKTISPFLIFIIISSLLINNPIKDKLFSTSQPSPENTETSTPNLNITPSEDIRKIVWQGAINLWREYPIFGTGTETFAHSYYWTRPASHNLTSEWNFLYNKAHNEYLNFLATTGAFGLLTYMILISTILISSLKDKNKLDPHKAIFTSITALLITNIVGFSVAITSLFLFTFPTLLLDKSNKKPKIKKTKIFLIPIFIIISLVILKKNINFFIADLYYSQVQKLNKEQDYQSAYQLIDKILILRPKQANYLSESALLASKLAVTTKEEKYLFTAIDNIDLALEQSPANINLWKERAQIYYYLSTLDNQYFQSTIDSLNQIQKLAPTDARNYYTIGQFLEVAQLTTESIPYYQRAIELKPNYDHAYFALGKIYFNQKEYQLAKENLNQTLKYAPNNTEAQQLLEKIK